MRAAIATITALAALAGAAAPAAEVEKVQPRYVVELRKGLLESPLDESLGPFYIPDGQCSGVLDDLLVCQTGSAPVAVRVAVEDAARFPLVALDDSLLRASVMREQPCSGEAPVTLLMACDEAVEDSAFNEPM